MDQHHVMILEKILPSGEEDWVCPTCGRRFLVNWEPKFSRKVLEIGDEEASHSGGKGGLEMGSVQVAPGEQLISEERLDSSLEEARLAPWQAWLDEVDFENLWKKDL